jgi:hypothetical protein
MDFQDYDRQDETAPALLNSTSPNRRWAPTGARS